MGFLTIRSDSFSPSFGRVVSWIILFWALMMPDEGIAQRVGLVLSGGGGRAMAHIGVLKALEENGIRIDYISGTSGGALIGGFYAAGFAPTEIEAISQSDQAQWLAPGLILQERYFYRRADRDGTFLEIPLFFRGTKRYLPENIVSDFSINIGLNQYLAIASARSGYNFDSLFVPLRITCSDIFDNKAVVLRNGTLAYAIRASIAAPFFFSGVYNSEHDYLFDGGIYDNFPVQPMIQDFAPDVIIGVHVGGGQLRREQITENGAFVRSLLSKHLIDQKVSQKLPPNSILIEPQLGDLSVFDFRPSSIAQAIQQGYDATIAKMDSIRLLIPSRVDSATISKKRSEFKAFEAGLNIHKLQVYGLNKWEQRYVYRLFGHKKKHRSFADLQRLYQRLIAEGNYSSIFPELIYQPEYDAFVAKMYIKPTPKITIRFGGTFFTPNDHQVQIGLRVSGRWHFGYEAELDFQQGSFANQAVLRAKLDLPTPFQAFIEVKNSVVSWDLQRLIFSVLNSNKSSYTSTQFLETQPSVVLPVNQHGRFSLSYAYHSIRDLYFIDNMRQGNGSPDRTFFNGNSYAVKYEHNTLNKKMYPNAGTYRYISVRWNVGQERFEPGTDKLLRLQVNRQWLQGFGQWQTFYRLAPHVYIGNMAEAAFSAAPAFSNYYATLLSSPKFMPFQDSPVLFVPALYNRAYGALGAQLALEITTKFFFRSEVYYKHSFHQLTLQPNGRQSSVFDVDWKLQHFYVSSGFHYDTPIGPIGIFANYYGGQINPARVILHIGYLIFNPHPWR
jgi:NTE family protein